MSPVTRSSLLAIAAVGVSFVAAQTGTFPATPLYSKQYPSPTDLPYQVDTDDLVRGKQWGYNICNSTTENQSSLCQTAYFNNATDFCLWGPPDPNKEVSDIEGEMIAWCTKPGRGTRLIPAGAITGLQYIKTPDYIVVVGFLDQTKINMVSNDTGGEMDPHGADLRGNPMGGVLYSDNFSKTPGLFRQVPDWHNFMGSNTFCFKACDPAGANRAHHCEHIYDRIGCAYNAPNSAKDGTFESCVGDNADFPGVYTAANGSVMTYTQPEGPIVTVGYTPRIPASSNCVSLTSSVVFAGLPTATGAAHSSSSGLSSVKRTGSSTGAGPLPTAGSITNDGTVLAVSGLSILGVVFSALFLA